METETPACLNFVFMLQKWKFSFEAEVMARWLQHGVQFSIQKFPFLESINPTEIEKNIIVMSYAYMFAFTSSLKPTLNTKYSISTLVSVFHKLCKTYQFISFVVFRLIIVDS